MGSDSLYQPLHALTIMAKESEGGRGRGSGDHPADGG